MRLVLALEWHCNKNEYVGVLIFRRHDYNSVHIALCHADRFLISGGKRDEKLILPTNSSISVTLDLNEVSLHHTGAIEMIP